MDGRKHEDAASAEGQGNVWLRALHDLAAQIAAGGPANDLLALTVDTAASLCRSDTAALYLWDMWNGLLQQVASTAVTSAGQAALSEGEAFAHRIWEQGEPLATTDGAGSGATIAAGVPLRVGGYRAGVLLIQRGQPALPFTGEEALLLEMAGMHAARIVERSHADEALQASESHLHSLMRHTSDVVSILDLDGTVRYVSPSIMQVVGYPPQALIGATAFGAIHPDDIDRVRSCFATVAASPHAVEAIEFRRQRRDGAWLHVEAIFNNLVGDPDVHGVVMNARDITKRKQTAEALRHQALHDPLTGLPNLALLQQRLEQAVATADREGGRLAVLRLDLDRFKEINDSFGHQTGDHLLQQAMPRLRTALRGADTVARLGGVEFALLLPGVATAGGAVTARKLLDALEPQFLVDNHELSLGASVGIAIYPEHGADAATLMHHADAAMQTARQQASGFSLYDPAPNPAIELAGRKPASVE